MCRSVKLRQHRVGPLGIGWILQYVASRIPGNAGQTPDTRYDNIRNTVKANDLRAFVLTQPIKSSCQVWQLRNVAIVAVPTCTGAGRGVLSLDNSGPMRGGKHSMFVGSIRRSLAAAFVILLCLAIVVALTHLSATAAHHKPVVEEPAVEAPDA